MIGIHKQEALDTAVSISLGKNYNVAELVQSELLDIPRNN